MKVVEERLAPGDTPEQELVSDTFGLVVWMPEPYYHDSVAALRPAQQLEAIEAVRIIVPQILTDTVSSPSGRSWDGYGSALVCYGQLLCTAFLKDAETWHRDTAALLAATNGILARMTDDSSAAHLISALARTLVIRNLDRRWIPAAVDRVRAVKLWLVAAQYLTAVHGERITCPEWWSDPSSYLFHRRLLHHRHPEGYPQSRSPGGLAPYWPAGRRYQPSRGWGDSETALCVCQPVPLPRFHPHRYRGLEIMEVAGWEWWTCMDCTRPIWEWFRCTGPMMPEGTEHLFRGHSGATVSYTHEELIGHPEVMKGFAPSGKVEVNPFDGTKMVVWLRTTPIPDPQVGTRQDADEPAPIVDAATGQEEIGDPGDDIDLLMP